MTSAQAVNENKDKFLKMSLQEKRKQYKCGDNYVTLSSVAEWSQEVASLPKQTGWTAAVEVRDDLNKKISKWRGDITQLEIDAIVNAANQKLAGGGGVDGAIHSAAGKDLLQAECRQIGGCPTGQAVLTGGYKLPAKYIIHTVGPVGEKPDLLASCYTNSLKLAAENNLRTIAFPCVSTGVYGYPHESAAEVALSTVRNFLETNGEHFDRIIFCIFLEVDQAAYGKLLPKYFPACKVIN